jgi:hypothetical protein
MAAYNGEKYLPQQLDSLFAQTVQNFALYIRDDCSADNTVGVAKAYAEKYPGRIFIEVSDKNSGSAKWNFLRMMDEHKADYTFLCDNDDFWLPGKIEKTMAKMRELEREHGENTPLLVHTDVSIADEDLNVTEPSYRKAVSHPAWEKATLRQVLPMNIATGFTECYNRALGDLIAAPGYVVMHDWWLLWIALCFGQVGRVYEPTALYRQHGGNELGFKAVNGFMYTVHKALNVGEIKERLANSYKQANEFLRCYGDRLDAGTKSLFEEYAGIPGRGKAGRVAKLIGMKIPRYSFKRNIAHLLFV